MESRGRPSVVEQQSRNTATSASGGPVARPRAKFRDTFWLPSSMVAILLAAIVVALELTLPGLPGAGVMGRLMALMSAVCSQRPAHSYTIGGIQLPMEARMMGMFGGLLVGMVELGTWGSPRAQRLPRRSLVVALALGLATMAFDGFNALFFDLGLPHAYTPDLRLRLATGAIAGVVMAFAIVPSVSFFDRQPRRWGSTSGPGWRDAAVATAAAAAFALLVASGWTPLLYPISITGGLGVVAGITLLNRAAIGQAADARDTIRLAMRREWILQTVACCLAVGELAALAAFNAHLGI